MLHFIHINLVVVLVRADPFDPHDALLEIDGDDQPIARRMGGAPAIPIILAAKLIGFAKSLTHATG